MQSIAVIGWATIKRRNGLIGDKTVNAVNAKMVTKASPPRDSFSRKTQSSTTASPIIAQNSKDPIAIVSHNIVFSSYLLMVSCTM